MHASAALAGGFAVREQSAYGLGAAFAGIAAADTLSAMFWNPAGVAAARELEVEAGAALLIPDTGIAGTATFQPIPGVSVPLGFLDQSGGSFSSPAAVPSLYAGEQVTERLSVGLAFNAPFGITTKPENDNWAGKFEARTSSLTTYNLNPVLGYRLAPNLVLGAGLQVSYADIALKSAYPGLGGLAGPNPNLTISGDALGAGYTLGFLWEPVGGTRLGAGYRSEVEHGIVGETFVAGIPAVGNAKITAGLTTPQIATASLRQQAGPRVALLATVEWTGWSVLDEVIVQAHTTNPALGAVSGKPLTTLPLHWHDGWFVSGGAEFVVGERTLLRTGAAFERSPIQDAAERSARVPDSDRVWVSVGATHRLDERASIDIAYSHVFFEGGPIDRTSSIGPAGSVRLLGEADQGLDIVAVSVRLKLGAR
jgi:long-chain fatty acid transport protein